jgi:EAL domain-containing protein (putative c-di-GMP-specific phosphodiesterase class I)
MNLVAEGVETEAQSRYLEANGCVTMQGYHYYRPIALADFIGALRAQAGQSGAVAIQA